MSLNATLQIGKTALAVNQAALQVVGNNIANAGNENYTRQVARLATAPDRQYRPGVFIGNGVNLQSIERQVDAALEQRLRGASSDAESGATLQQWLGRVESTFNALSEDDLASQFSQFFNGWSNLANRPQDMGLRQVVVQNGQQLGQWFGNLRGQLSSLAGDAAARLTAVAQQADQIASRIAELNGRIATTEGAAATGGANGLRDERDALLRELSTLVDVTAVERDGGMVDVYVGSEQLVAGRTNRGIIVRTETVESINGEPRQRAFLAFRADNGRMAVNSGQLGAIVNAQAQIDDAGDRVDTLAKNFIFEVNKLHASGQGLRGFDSTSATNLVEDPAAALSSDAAGLDFRPTNGSFVVHVTNRATGQVTSTLVQVPLTGGAGDATLNSLASSIDAVAGVGATVNAGRLTVSAESPAVSISFSQDSSGVLAALGVNSFFSGTGAGNMAVSEPVRTNPQLLAAARNGSPGDNQTARAIADLQGQALSGLNGVSLRDYYQQTVNNVAANVAAAKTTADAAQSVRDTLQAQRDALSGVSLDEEAINLVRQQRAFQLRSRLVSVVNEMMDEMLALVR